MGSNSPTIIIVGAGFSGIAAAIMLKTQLGFHRFTIIEKASDIGGTWRENTYPGSGCDLAVHFYSLSTDLKHDWTHTYEKQPQILSYMKDLVKKYDLIPHLVFKTKVVSAYWLPELQHYSVTLEDTSTGARTVKVVQIIIAANGILHVPKWPDIPGLKTFNGCLMHSAEWQPDVDLRGKKVAVIGGGSSASQIVPRIAEIEGVQVTQFTRTRNWYFPITVRRVDQLRQKVFLHAPFLLRAYRFWVFLQSELKYLVIFRFQFMRTILKKVMALYISRVAPKEYHDDLIPEYLFGCRRVIFDYDYLDSLNRPNVHLIRNGIGSIGENGIITTGGEKLAFDVIVCATGFVTNQSPFAVHGNDGSLQEYGVRHGGPTAYLGTVVPGFPNFYTLSGPNTVTGYTSVLFFVETQLNYIAKLIKPVLEGKVSSFEVTSQASDAYNKKIQDIMQGTVFPHCSSWYRVGDKGKNASIFPGSAVTFWWWMRSVKWTDYKAVGERSWIQDMQKKQESRYRLAALVVGAFSIAVFWSWGGLWARG